MKKGKGNSEKREGWGRGKVGRGKGGKEIGREGDR